MGLVERFLSDHFPEIGHRDFYRDLFPVGALEARGEYVDGRYCGIAVQVVGKAKAKRYSVTDDLDVIDIRALVVESSLHSGNRIVAQTKIGGKSDDFHI